MEKGGGGLWSLKGGNKLTPERKKWAAHNGGGGGGEREQHSSYTFLFLIKGAKAQRSGKGAKIGERYFKDRGENVEGKLEKSSDSQAGRS